MIIAVTGLPGSGKSYFASRLAQKLDAAYLSSDKLRKEVVPEGSYTHEEKMRVYNEMLERMKEELSSGRSVVLDATFHARQQRQNFHHTAINHGQKWYLIYITATDSIIKKRLSKKREHSEADWEVYLKLRKEFEPIYQHHLVLKSDEDNLDDMMDTALQYLGKE